MNEKIKQLAKQATEHYSNGQERAFDKEKFAELIVRECGLALSPMLRDMVSRGQAYDLIKKHFGINK